MNSEYLNLLARDIRDFVSDIERQSAIEIQVEVDELRAKKDLGEINTLACDIDETGARILIPSADYFPEGSVLHELLHIDRFLVQGVPQISVCEEYWCPELESAFTDVDNTLEHLVIVPEELRRRPDRKHYWVRVMERTIEKIGSDQLQQPDRDFLAVYSWTFVRRVLGQAQLERLAWGTIESLDLIKRANAYWETVVPALDRKEDATRALTDVFNLAVEAICLNYLDSRERECRQQRLV
jgi:hypothetical protein